MASQTDIKNFEGNKIRTVWSADEGKYYFSVVDVVQVLTEQPDYNLARNYWKTTKNRFQLVTNCNQLKLLAADGKYYKTDVADEENLLIIAQQIQPQKVEKLKQWLENLNAVETVDTGEIIMYQPDETIKLEVRMDNDTVWLTQQQMAELFETSRNNITLHIDNIFKERELISDSVSKDSLLTAADGKKYRTKLYNLDVIISVGYRVKSLRGTQFRQWANRVLKDYMLRGYSINQRLERLERRETVLTMLSKRAANVSATIYTKQNSPDFQLAVRRYNAQYPPITVNLCQNVHDRFLIIDDTVYLFGASLKDAGKKMFSFIKMQETPAAVILGMVR